MSDITAFRNMANKRHDGTIRVDTQASSKDNLSITSVKNSRLSRLGRFLADPMGAQNKRVKEAFISAFSKSYPNLQDKAKSLVDVKNGKPLKASVVLKLLNKADKHVDPPSLTYAGADMGKVKFKNADEVENAFKTLVKKGGFDGDKVAIFEFAKDPVGFAVKREKVEEKIAERKSRFVKGMEEDGKKREQTESSSFASDKEGLTEREKETRTKKFEARIRPEMEISAVRTVGASLRVPTDFRLLTNAFVVETFPDPKGEDINPSVSNLWHMVPVRVGGFDLKLFDQIELAGKFSLLPQLGAELHNVVSRRDEAAISRVGESFVKLVRDVQEGVSAMKEFLSKSQVRSAIINVWRQNDPSLSNSEASKKYDALAGRVSAMKHYMQEEGSFMNQILSLGFVAMQKPGMVLEELGQPLVVPERTLEEQDLEEKENDLKNEDLPPSDTETPTIQQLRLTEQDLGETEVTDTEAQTTDGDMQVIGERALKEDTRDRNLGEAKFFDIDEIKMS